MIKKGWKAIKCIIVLKDTQQVAKTNKEKCYIVQEAIEETM